jgi:hypothetical protein
MVMISTQPAKKRKVPHFMAHRMDRKLCRHSKTHKRCTDAEH